MNTRDNSRLDFLARKLPGRRAALSLLCGAAALSVHAGGLDTSFGSKGRVLVQNQIDAQARSVAMAVYLRWDWKANVPLSCIFPAAAFSMARLA